MIATVTRVAALTIAACAVASSATAAARIVPPATSVARYGVAEVKVVLDTPPPGNPFVDAALTGELRGPAGETTRVEGFCDAADGRTFVIRFMPVQAGPHTYTLSLTGGGRVIASGDGRFAAVESGAGGLLRVDPAAPAHFLWEGTRRHVFLNGTTAYWLLGFTDPATITAALDRLAGLGINRIRVALNGRTRDGLRWREPAIVPTAAFRFRLEPWPAASPESVEAPQYDVTRFNVDHFRRAEQAIAHARRLGMVVSVIFHLDGADAGVDPFGKVAMGGADEQRYYRYVVARLGAYANVTWDLTNEWHLFRDEVWVERMGTLVREADPYDHLISVHGRGTFPFRTSPWADFAMFQSWDEHGGYRFMLENRRQQQATGRPMPQINEEYGYEDHYPFPWGQARRWPSRTADTRRRLAWEMTMAGTYQTTGERADEPTYGGWLTGHGSARMTMLEGYRHLRRFFESLPWWRLEPRPDLVTVPPEPPIPANARAAAGDTSPTPALHGDPMLLAEPGVRYVVYLPRGGRATITLAPGRYTARWFNPRTGTYAAATTRVVQTDATPWTAEPAPDALDWVLVLARITTSQSPAETRRGA